MSENKVLVQCYNRGCGKKFDPENDTSDSCIHHPGAPYFHDAYKGWTCCNKKCTDFTEFLNIKGCTKSSHNPVKPPEPEKPAVDNAKLDEIIAAQEAKKPAPILPSLPRPSFDTPLTTLTPQVATALEQQVKNIVVKAPLNDNIVETTEIPIGTSCKNGGCKACYEGPDSNSSSCMYHPGSPVFHEGYKFWTCCNKRTSDFTAFLDQKGCCVGTHVWIKEKTDNKISCRYDWHQTASHVVISIFAKKYDPRRSSVELSPVRLKIQLYFPEEDNTFDLDVELRGIIDVAQSTANMLSTKLEVKLRKAEPGSWSKLDFPRNSPASKVSDNKNGTTEDVSENDYVDLSDL